MTKLPPVQFNLPVYWNRNRSDLLRLDSVTKALAQIEVRWHEVAQFKYEENSPHDEESAQEELELDMHIGRVKVRDLRWLIHNFENGELIELVEAIAEHAMPGAALETLEKGETAVVTDHQRTTVFDMKFGQEVSAGVSLFWAGDRKYTPNATELEEFNTWIGGRIAQNERRIEIMRGHFEKFGHSGSVHLLQQSEKE